MWMLGLPFGLASQALASEVSSASVALTVLPSDQQQTHWMAVNAINQQTVWISGSQGRVARTTDAGKTWQYFQPGPSDLQFRDIAALDDRVAYALSVGENGRSRIYSTHNGGRSWQQRYRADADRFLNCFAFSDSGEAWVYGDTVNEQWTIVRSADGRNWLTAASAISEPAQANEGGFASGGGCVRYANETWAMVTGNADKARLLLKGRFGIRFQVVDTPMSAGPMAGITSVWPTSPDSGYIVGGNLQQDEATGPRLYHYQEKQFSALAEPPLAGGALYHVSLADNYLLVNNPAGAALLALTDDHDPAHKASSPQWQSVSTANVWSSSCISRRCWLVGKDGYVAYFSLPN
ncbi:WD40/YVTN/BNR-like repeat-containing protein [Idiomarina xiamenensis]|uniref:BNR repeat-containing protein n=1 Tax=Idiomarina xiamenensis 10-D-4 TaxID=740709 RepID=K2JK82_9GAMM|nr:hypothetical protein [Idiomarina xiamenensis]EKE83871.1 BNR repeat-containing protein [Idiomarina xiamenensis 10-D-4]